MTTKSPKSASRYQLPDPPERTPDEMTAFNHLTTNGSVYHLIQHLGTPETTLVGGEQSRPYASPMSPVPDPPRRRDD